MSELYMIVLQGKEELGNDPEAIRLWAELSGVDIESIDENTPFDIDTADRLLRTLPEVMERMRQRTTQELESLEEKLKQVLESKEEPTETETLLENLERELEEKAIFPMEEAEEMPTAAPAEAHEEPAEVEEVVAEPAEITAEMEESVPETAEAEEVPVAAPVEAHEEPAEAEETVAEVPAETPKEEYEVVIGEAGIHEEGLVRLFRFKEGKVEVLKGDWKEDFVFLVSLASCKVVDRLVLALKNGHTLYGERVGDSYLVAEFDHQNVGIAKLMFAKIKRALGS
ncbi:MAG: hypothetical protein GXO29_06895 [Thermotogae bacterium]|nr:hypothetical protein [Thermotogota bacterium]